MKTFLRTSIVLNDSSHDIQIHAHEPVSTTVYEVLRCLKEDFIEKGRDTAWLEDPDVSWTLERYGRRQLDMDKTLAEQGLYDGTRLYLVKNASNETYPLLDDDLTEAVARGSERVPEWRYDLNGITLANHSLAALGIGLSTAAVLGLGWAARLPDIAHYGAAAALLLAAIVATALAVPLSKTKDLSLPNSLAVAGYAMVAAAAFTAIPRPPGLWHIPVVASAVIIYGIIFKVLAPNLIEVHAAALSAFVPVLVIGVITLCLEMFAPSYVYGMSPTAGQVMFLALLILVYAPTLSMSLGKIPTPEVKTAGQGVHGDDSDNLHRVSRGAGDDPNRPALHDVNVASSGREATERIINRDQQVADAHRYLVGLLIGSCSAIAVSAAFLGYGVSALGKHYWLVFAFAMVTAVCMFNHGRTYRPADARRTIYVASGATVVSYLGGLVVSDPSGNVYQIVAGAALVTVYVLVGCLWSLAQKTIKSPLTQRKLELLDAGFFLLPLPLLAFIMDAWTLIRNR